MNIVLKVHPQQSSEGDDHFPRPTGCTIPAKGQDAIDLLGHVGVLLAQVQTSFNRHTHLLFLPGIFSTTDAQACSI